jgi:hypothetical protein
MWHILLCLLSLALLTQSSDAPVYPLLTCWFQSYGTDGGRVLNVILGYNNTGNESINLPTQQGENTLTPYNGLQPDVFSAGVWTYTLVLENVTESLNWTLDNTTLLFDVTNLLPQQRCNQALSGHCPMWIDGFCEDSVYCNGAEFCFSSQFNVNNSLVIGACSAPQQGIQCVNGSVCNETMAQCEYTPAPTQAPTPQPTETPTEAPTQTPTNTPTEAPTEAPTYGSIDITVSLGCWYLALYNHSETPMLHVAMNYINPSINPVARPITQNTAHGLANLLVPAYNGQQPILFLVGQQLRAFTIIDTSRLLESGVPLQWYLGHLIYSINPVNFTEQNHCSNRAPTAVQCSVLNTDCSSYNTFCGGVANCNTTSQLCVHDASFSPCATVDNQDSIMVTVCVEEIQFCGQTTQCQTNEQCNNGLICDGQEWCNNGTCEYQMGFCNETGYVCVEGVGCLLEEQQFAISTTAIGIIAIVATVVVLALIVFISLYFYYTRSSNSSSRKSKRK